jgi:hypothetical protein
MLPTAGLGKIYAHIQDELERYDEVLCVLNRDGQALRTLM